MPNTQKLRFCLVLSAMAAICTIAAAPPAGQGVTPKPELTASSKQFVLTMVGMFIKTAYAPGADFATWPQLLQKAEPAIDKAQTPREFVAAVNEAFRQYHVSHLVLWSPQAAQTRSENKTIGIGINLQVTPDGLLVTNVLPGAPADKGGLVAGDVIVEVDGKKPADQAPLAGTEGSKVKIKLKRASGGSKVVTLTRAKFVSVRPATLTWLTKDSAVLKIPTFDVAYDAANVEKLMGEAAGATNLVVDLRSNPGGSISSFQHLLGLFMKEGTPLGTFVTREVADRFAKGTGAKPDDSVAIARWAGCNVVVGKGAAAPYRGQVAVLVNGATGSAAEMAAAALHEGVAAPIVGSRSAGAVLESVMLTLPATGYLFQYPISDYVTRHGVRLEGRGVEPEATTPTPRPGARDVAVELALDLLRREELRELRYGKH